jgi:ankyrin repeat protein
VTYPTAAAFVLWPVIPQPTLGEAHELWVTAIENRDQDGTTAVMRHAKSGDLSILRKVLALGADVHARDYNGHCALWHARLVERSSTAETIAVLLDAGANGGSALVEAAWKGQAAVITQLLAAGVDVNAVGSHGFTALMGSASEGHLEIAKQLLAARANVHGRDKYRRTTLSMASGFFKKREMVRLLLAHKADINESWKEGTTALMTAVHCRNKGVVAELIASKADVNARDSQGSTALGMACDDDIIQQLKDAGGST